MSKEGVRNEDNITDRVHNVLNDFRERAAVGAGEPIGDAVAAAGRLGFEVVYDEVGGRDCSRHTATAIVIDREAGDDPDGREDAVRHGLVHALLLRDGVRDDLLASKMRPSLADATVETLAGAMDRALAAPADFILELMARNTEADNFLFACEANLPLHWITMRMLDIVANPFTRDARLGLHLLNDILRRCNTRVGVIGDGCIDDKLECDPREAPNDLIQTQALGILESIRRAVDHEPGEDAGRRIFQVLKAIGSADFAIFIEHLPLRITKAIIISLLSLPASEAAIALGLFYLKLGHFSRARGLVENMKWVERVKAAEGLALLARIEKLTNPDKRAAEAIYREAKKKDQRCEEAVTGLANTLIALKEYGPALRVLSVLGDAASANYYRGKTYEVQGDYDEALAFYNRVVFGPWWRYNDIDPATTWNRYKRKALSRMAYIYSVRNQHELALDRYALLFTEHPYDAESLQKYVPYLLRLGRVDEAVQRIMTLGHVAPLQPWCFRMLGDAYTQEGRDDFALPMYLAARLLGETTPKVRRAA